MSLRARAINPKGLTGAALRSDSRSEVALRVESISLFPTEAMSTRYGCGSAACATEPNAATANRSANTEWDIRCEGYTDVSHDFGRLMPTLPRPKARISAASNASYCDADIDTGAKRMSNDKTEAGPRARAINQARTSFAAKPSQAPSAIGRPITRSTTKSAIPTRWSGSTVKKTLCIRTARSGRRTPPRWAPRGTHASLEWAGRPANGRRENGRGERSPLPKLL